MCIDKRMKERLYWHLEMVWIEHGELHSNNARQRAKDIVDEMLEAISRANMKIIERTKLGERHGC
ncbi:MAG: hypothetical protein GF411_08840 [Candidatus Lokiarchaeota archaeon]|nr:hypothetical protein [Candidatus Lokiarchaeota archaeon]